MENGPGRVEGEDEDEDEDEDEETLQLKLQEIQARLRLKKLQKEKSKPRLAKTDDVAAFGAGRPVSPQKPPLSQEGSQLASMQDRPQTSQPIVVPASPVRRVNPSDMQTSPSRVLLGIDKGRKAKDVSLKRPPSLRKKMNGQASPTKTSASFKDLNGAQSAAGKPRPQNFNERLAAARTEEDERRERQRRIERIRSNAFAISRDEMDQMKSSAVEIPDEELRAPEFSREQILQGNPSAASGSGLQRSNTTSGILTQRSETKNGTLADSIAGAGDTKSDPSSFEAYSSFHLSKRIMPHGTLARQLRQKRLFGVKDLLRQVKSPGYQLPDVEEDIVVFAIVASKSEPRAHKPTDNGTKALDRGKYMVMTIVDLEWELELFLFNSGFTRFWKIPEGTVVAILNPNVMPPPRARAHSGKFSLCINSDADTIIEVGTARDLGFCKSMKKDGSICSSWLNKKRTEFCEFHSNEIVRKARSSRSELNQMGFGGEYKKKQATKKQGEERASRNGTYDRETGTHWFATKSMSAASLIDGAADRKEREEALKRRVVAREKEQQMMKALSKAGSGTGQEYMRYVGAKAAPSSSVSVASSASAVSTMPSSSLPKPPDAQDLGLIGKRNKPTISLSPVKRKRPDSSQSLASTESGGSGGGLGWGGGLKSKLSRMRDGETLGQERKGLQSPVKKKTRFITSKGIREAGRESLGNDLAEQVELDDDDELVILR